MKFIETLETLGYKGCKSTEFKLSIPDILLEYVKKYATELEMSLEEYIVLVLANQSCRLENVKENISALQV